MLITVEYKAFAISAGIVAAILIWDRIQIRKRTRWIESHLRKMEKKIYLLEIQESGRLMRLVRELNRKSRVKVDSPGAAEMAFGDGLTVAAPTTAAQRECANRQNRRRSSRPLLLLKPVSRRNASEEQLSDDHASRPQNPSDREGHRQSVSGR
jgi:hypothetical protein